jgi:imidazolonepropionase-like amidohydrolase
VNPITVETNANVHVIAANGRVLMPGLIDAHWHAFMAATPQMLVMTADPPTSNYWPRDRQRRR